MPQGNKRLFDAMQAIILILCTTRIRMNLFTSFCLFCGF